MDVSNFVQTVAIYALPVLFAITLHEAAHGYVARHFGDMTAYAQGRISLNPARHIDLVGTILVPIAILVASKLAGTTGLPVRLGEAGAGQLLGAQASEEEA
jgi:Zn-dependent protease